MALEVLIVDDAAFMRATLKMILAKNGFEIVGEAENGDMAFEQYRLLKPDLVTMDITMPICNGIEAVKLIKSAGSVVVIFQLASTAFTITLNGVFCVVAVGLPVLPEADPAAAVSPGNNICN